MDRVLRLPVNTRWYALIANGTLDFDYREIKPFWSQRLEGKEYDIVEFYNRFKSDVEPLRYKFEWIKKGHLKGYEPLVYIIKFGDKI